MDPKISVIVPVYKVEKYLNRCIESIVDQTYKNLEIILVDDGSPDNCPQICDEWSEKDPRIRVIHQKNGGLSVARNTGIRVAQGDYLYFVDSDDWVAQDLCEKTMKAFSLYNVDIVTFDCEKVTESGVTLGGTENLKNGVLSPKDALKELLLGNINNYAWNKIYKRKIFENIWFPEGRTFEDMACAYKLLLNANRIYCMNEKLYYYLQRNDSITATINSKKSCDVFLARQESYINLKESYPDIAEIIYPRVVLCALRLYDISLWENPDEEVLNAAVGFLRDNKEKILRTEQSIKIRLYYFLPGIYNCMRRTKHTIGNMVKYVKRKIK